MKINSVTLYKTPLDENYENVFDVNSRDAFLNVWDKKIINFDKQRSFSINKIAQLSLHWDYNENIREYNYIKIDRYFYFITSIIFNDSLNQYLLNLKYDDFTNNYFTINGRSFNLIDGHISPILKLPNGDLYRNKIIVDESFDFGVESIVPSDNFYRVIYMRILYEPGVLNVFDDNTIPAISPLRVRFLPYCVININTLKIVDTITHYQIYGREGTKLLMPYFNPKFKFTLGTANIVDVDLTMAFQLGIHNNDGEITPNIHIDETKNVLYIYDDEHTIIYGSESSETCFVFTDYYRNGNSFILREIPINKSPEKYNVESIGNIDLNFKINNSCYSENFLNEYTLYCGDKKINLPFLPNLTKWLIYLFPYNKISPHIEIVGEFESLSGVSERRRINSIPITINTSGTVPFNVEQVQQWLRNNKFTLMSSMFWSGKGIMKGLSITTPKRKQISKKGKNIIEGESEKISGNVAQLTDMIFAGSECTNPQFYSSDTYYLLDCPIITNKQIYYTEDSLIQDSINESYVNGVNNVNYTFLGYQEQCSTFNYVRTENCVLTDIRDLESRENINRALSKGVKFWRFIDFEQNISKNNLKIFSPNTPNVILGKEI